MHKSTIAKLVLALGVLAAAEVNAAIIYNGIRYTEYWKTSRCPDGRARWLYQGKYYCRTYGVSISWDAPLKRTNGTRLTESEIGSYEIYWTRDSDGLSRTIKKAKTARSTLFYVLRPDIYNFAMSTVDTSGRKSPLSAVVSKKIGS